MRYADSILDALTDWSTIEDVSQETTYSTWVVEEILLYLRSEGQVEMTPVIGARPLWRRVR